MFTQKCSKGSLPAIPDEIRTLFSKRTAAGELLAKQFTRERGEDWDSLAPDQREARTKQATQDRDQVLVQRKRVARLC